MDLEQRLRASLVAPDPGPTFTARVMARLGRGAARRRSSLILMGTVLVVGAAAAMLAWQMSDMQSLPIEHAAVPVAADPESFEEQPVVQAMPEVSEPVGAAPKPAPATDNSPRYSIEVMPLRQEAQDASKRGPVEAFYAAMLDELRKVPGLTLHLPGDSERGAGGQTDYVLTITSLGTRVSQSGNISVRSTDGSTTYTVLGGGMVVASRNEVDGQHVTNASINGGGSGDPENALWVEMKVEAGQSVVSPRSLPVGAEGTTSTYGSGAMSGVVNLALNNRLSGFNVDMDYGANATGDGGNPRIAAKPALPRVEMLHLQAFPPDAVLQTPAQLAATQVEMLRVQVFPPDAAFQQRLVARLGDAGRDEAAGMRALQDLLLGLTGNGGSRLDAGTIQALVRYAAGQSSGPRLYIWSALRSVSHPALVAPLVESLRHDADQQVRLAALANLEANHSADPSVRDAFESLDRDDTDASVRVAIRRALYGQAQWRDEILAALRDTNLPYEARLAPLLVGGLEISPRQQGQRRAALQEQQVLYPVTTLIREHLRDSGSAEVTRDVLGLLGNTDGPAIFDLFMPLMREASLLDREISVRGNAISMSGPITGWVARHRNDPRVIASLRDADPRLRTVFDRMETPLQPMALPAMGDEPVIPSSLIERMREVLEKPAPSAPRAQ